LGQRAVTARVPAADVTGAHERQTGVPERKDFVADGNGFVKHDEAPGNGLYGPPA